MIAAGGRADTAMIGDILGGQLRRRGAVGLVCDGAVRDTAVVAGWADFPGFARSVTPRGPSAAERGVVNGSVVIGGCLIRPGDLLIGDDDGLVALKPEAVRERVGAAEAKLKREAGRGVALAVGSSVVEAPDLAQAPVRRRT